MKSLRFTLPIALLVLTTAAFAQSDAQQSDAQPSSAQQSGAQQSFSKLKALAGNWEGPATLVPPQPEMASGKPMHVSMRVTSRGNSLVHEMQESGTPEDATKYDHPVTMFYIDRERLLLTHYCDAGNRPRMVAKTSPDGKTVEFDYLDVAGDTHYGHMHHALFTFIDANHHTEDWTFMVGEKMVQGHFDLRRAQ